MTTIGILSDTHLDTCSTQYSSIAKTVFHDCEYIIHAGDLTDISVLDCFGDKLVYAVCGNMCNHRTHSALPQQRVIQIDDYTIAIHHGMGMGYAIEDRLFEHFATADCIIYGHTHKPVCHYIGSTLLLNPGSFKGTGPYGAPGTYATLEIQPDGLHGLIHELERSI